MSTRLEARAIAIAGRLRPTDLDLETGGLVALIGPNGSGKTSLLHALAGISQATGTVQMEGIDPRRAPVGQRKNLLSFLPATREVHWPLSAQDLVRLGGGDDDQVGSSLMRLGLADAADRRVDRLSTGERNRIMLARAMSTTPRLLLLDEPAANLDPFWQLEVMAMLRADAARNDQLILVAMHDLDLAERFADRLLLMSGRSVVADGDPQSLLESPLVQETFRIVRQDGAWQPVSPTGDRQSSR